jgi:hypothetical protein
MIILKTKEQIMKKTAEKRNPIRKNFRRSFQNRIPTPRKR